MKLSPTLASPSSFFMFLSVLMNWFKIWKQDWTQDNAMHWEATSVSQKIAWKYKILILTFSILFPKILHSLYIRSRCQIKNWSSRTWIMIYVIFLHFGAATWQQFLELNKNYWTLGVEFNSQQLYFSSKFFYVGLRVRLYWSCDKWVE